MAERYTRDEVLSMVICDDDDDYIMEHFEPGSDDELGLIVMLKNSSTIFKKYTYIKKLLFF